MRHALVLILALVLDGAPAWAQDQPAPAEPQEQQQAQAIGTVIQFMKAGRPQDAIVAADKVISHYEERYRKGKTFVFSARSELESLAYLMDVAANQATAPGNAAVYSRNWGDAYHLKGYALLELRRPTDALAALQAAVGLAPRNAQYLTELGQVQVALRDLAGAMQSFTRAEKAARDLSPPDTKTTELTRALRSQGFLLIERKQFDLAEKLYRECLELDPADRNAQRELAYIEKVRQSGRPPVNLDALWSQAVRQNSDGAAQAYQRQWIVPRAADAVPTTWPQDKAVSACLGGAGQPRAAYLQMVFTVDAAGLVTDAATNRSDVLDECVRRETRGLQLAPPPSAPFLVCSEYARVRDREPGNEVITVMGCGPAPQARMCKLVNGGMPRCTAR